MNDIKFFKSGYLRGISNTDWWNKRGRVDTGKIIKII